MCLYSARVFLVFSTRLVVAYELFSGRAEESGFVAFASAFGVGNA